MLTSIHQFIDRQTASGRLALIGNLLYDIVLVGWIAFAGLYALEVLLPTFVMARLSLVKFSLLLLIATSLLIWIAERIELRATTQSVDRRGHPFIITGLVAGLAIIALAHYRFPWWSIPMAVAGYAIVSWLFYRYLRSTSDHRE